MPKPTDITLKSARCQTSHIDYRSPIKFGGRVVNDVTIFDCEVDVETSDGKTATGKGSMTMGNVWAWPSSQVTVDQSLDALVQHGQALVQFADGEHITGHPLELTHQLSSSYDRFAQQVCDNLELPESMPRLAQLVSASPLEAAIHDAYGRIHNANAYNLLGQDFCNTDLSHYLNDDFAGEYLHQYTSRDPKHKMPLYHLVGALDPMTEADITERIEDGLPMTLGEWILADGLTHLKIKLAGDDLAWDIERVCAIESAADAAQEQRACTTWHYSCDFNEKCANVEYVLEFLAKLKERSPEAWDRVQYIEQPTHRDLRSNPENKMHEAAKIKPVVIDESLIDFETFQLAREQGYSGVALKACKGHTEALLMGAAAQKYNLFLCVQDLTCVGYSFLHSASLAARLPTIAAIEGNGRQYCPAGNTPWQPSFPGMFNITDGTVATGELSGVGLGF